jgi:transcriptional regulator with GAF, ATPase, and Fis domain
MERYAPLLLDVWREACRHIVIGESVERIAPILARRLPVDSILVRHLDPKGVIETVAVGRSRPGPLPRCAKDRLGPEELHRVRAWVDRAAVVRPSDRPEDRLLRALLPEGIEGDILMGPLQAPPGGAAGILILGARPNQRFLDDHADLVRALLEPFTVALENDRRLRELTSLREAVEADNRSLLSRLGRHDISDSIVGAETGLKPVMDQIELVAPADAPVLVLGETGSGKEVVARAIHTRSRRARGPFLRVNCGAIPPELVDSELFGHEKGSFTGAMGQRKGWFERADGGTLFLDEVGELPPAAQVRLLRVLQDGMLDRVGSERPIHVDVRILAATHRDLQSMVAEGRFRQDLWYRIAVFPIRLPPLRERLDDVAPLAAHFALRAAARLGMPPLVPTAEDMGLLASYPWPGNVRELAAVIERAAILGGGRRLEVGLALGASPSGPSGGADGLRPAAPPPTRAAPSGAIESLDAATARHIEAALARTRGRIEGPSGAAALLKINPHTLRARMRKLKVDWRRFRASGEEVQANGTPVGQG